MQRRYITVDVFNGPAFGGNPLAVVLDAGRLSSAELPHLPMGEGHTARSGSVSNKTHTCGATRFSILTPSRSSMISAIHCRWQCRWSRS
jgi:hypothetical protein